MVKVEVMMDEKALLARHLMNLKLIKLSWALFFILIGGSFLKTCNGLTIRKNGLLYMRVAAGYCFC
ncbi:MAG: hypothetical protein PHU34_09290 [Candidatus Methanoperedens sp.]|nr:hypothetical protein [Candidatus Methanoperedens sp.]